MSDDGVKVEKVIIGNRVGFQVWCNQQLIWTGFNEAKAGMAAQTHRQKLESKGKKNG